MLDANKAGSKSPEKVRNVHHFTEGDLASMAVAGLSEVGREYYGVFPLQVKSKISED